MKHQIKRILQSTALKLMLLIGLFGVNTAALAAATVSLTSPAPNTKVAAPGSFVLAATVSSTNSSVKNVAFYSGTTLLFTDTTAPYTYTWNNVAVGTYSITARVNDKKNAKATSAAVSVTVVNNVPPSVSLTSPAANTVSLAPASFSLTASASSTTSTISKVEFYNGTTLLGTSTTAPYSYTWSNVAAGSYSLTAKATDAFGAETTSGAVAVISNASPSVSITSPANNTALNAPASFNLSASASDSDGSIAKVEYFNGATLIGTATSAPYSVTWSNVAIGNYSITAKATDNRGAITTSAPISITSKQATSSTSVTATPNPAKVGQATTLNATVTGSNPTGTVTFKDGTTTLGTGTLTAGAASLSYTFNNAVAHSITAEYVGDTNNTASTSDAAALTVNTAATTTALTLTPSNVTVGNSVAMSATITGLNPTGTVNFMDGANTIGSGTLTAGVASFNYTATTAGSQNITAVYAGDANNASSTSTANVLTVNKVDSITSLSVTPNPARPLEPITMTATVTGFNPVGTVNFMDGATLLGSSPVSAGVATFSTSFMDAGVRPITAAYSGDPVNTPSTSLLVNMDVAKVASTTTLSVTPSPARPGEPVTMTATVTGFNPTGVVSFMEGGYVMGGATVNGGVATFSTSFPAAGSYVITALYGADQVNEASYSAPLVLTINTGVAQAYFIHSDHLNTPRSITDLSGAVVWQWDNSDPFGNNSPNENPAGQGAFNFNLRFAGQYFDRETNTHYNINRDYDPATGRYIESDPIGLGGGINTYTYVEGDPLSYTDPEGLKGGNARQRRTDKRNSPRKIENPEGVNNTQEAGGYFDEEGDFVCLRWNCPQNKSQCTDNDIRNSNDYMPPATDPKNPPSGCTCDARVWKNSNKPGNIGGMDILDLLNKTF